jgi:hypothetical protein
MKSEDPAMDFGAGAAGVSIGAGVGVGGASVGVGASGGAGGASGGASGAGASSAGASGGAGCGAGCASGSYYSSGGASCGAGGGTSYCSSGGASGGADNGSSCDFIDTSLGPLPLEEVLTKLKEYIANLYNPIKNSKKVMNELSCVYGTRVRFEEAKAKEEAERKAQEDREKIISELKLQDKLDQYGPLIPEDEIGTCSELIDRVVLKILKEHNLPYNRDFFELLPQKKKNAMCAAIIHQITNDGLVVGPTVKENSVLLAGLFTKSQKHSPNFRLRNSFAKILSEYKKESTYLLTQQFMTYMVHIITPVPYVRKTWKSRW